MSKLKKLVRPAGRHGIATGFGCPTHTPKNSAPATSSSDIDAILDSVEAKEGAGVRVVDLCFHQNKADKPASNKRVAPGRGDLVL